MQALAPLTERFGKDSKGAQEFYGFYRRTLSLSKVSGTPMANGLIRDVNLVGRVDLQTKNIQYSHAPEMETGTMWRTYFIQVAHLARPHQRE